MLHSSSADVRVVAVRYLCVYGRPYLGSKLNELLEDDDRRVRIAATGSLAQDNAIEKQELRASLADLCRTNNTDSEPASAEAALLLGTINDPTYDDLLIQLLRHESPVVLRAALEGAAKTRRRIFVSLIVPHLADETTMFYSQRALREYGDRVVHALRDYVDDESEPEAVKRAIPGAYAAIGSQKAMDALLALLEDHHADLGSVIIEAIGEIHSRYRDLEVDEATVESALDREVQAGLPDQRAERERRLRDTIGLLALVYPAEDVHRAYAGMTSGDRDTVSNAVELLDNLMGVEHKRTVLPLVEACVT